MAAVVLDPPQAVLADLRAARRRRRIDSFDVGEAVYRAYMTFVLTGIAVWLLSGVVGDTRVHGATVTRTATDAPWVVGAAMALGWAVGLRSGGRGGPLALEAADVRHVLLSPVDRTLALRRPALRQLRSGAALGAGAGAVAGLLAWRRLPGDPVAWLACGALVGAAAVASGLGLAMVASGRRLGRLVSSAVAVAVAGWSVADAVARTTTSPATFLGEVAVWPLRFGVAGLVGVAVAALAAAGGLAVVGGLSVERAESRASLVGQMRFAAALKDVRTVVVLRRQLTQEQSRQRPWVRVPGRRSARLPVFRRGWHGITRFPGVRFARLLALGAGAGAAGVGVWSGTTPLLLAVGACLFVAGLDSVEPLAQELDHPDRRAGYPTDAPTLVLRLLAAPAVLMVGVCAVGVGVATVVAAATGGGAALAAEVGGVVAVPAALAGLAGAAVSVVQGAPAMFSSVDTMLPPEAAGLKTLIRLVVPPGLGVLAGLPLVVGHRVVDRAHPVSSAVGLTPEVLLGALLVGLYIRYHDDMRAWWVTAMADARANQGAAGAR